MRILFIVGKVVFDVYKHIVDFLEKNEIEVDVKKIGPRKPNETIEEYWRELRYGKGFHKLCRKRNYDFILSTTHSEALIPFYNAVKPKIGFIDIGHDLLDLTPHPFPNYGKSAILTFQKYQYSYSKKLGGRSVFSCRWTKLDMEYDYVDYSMFDIDKYEDAIIIGGPGINDIEFINGMDGFNRLWCKTYLPTGKIPTGTKALSEIFCYPRGVKHCCDACKFIITARSSCYLEALFFGSMPILFSKDLSSEQPVNDIISKVSLYRQPKFKFNAITTTNCGYKVDQLRKDPALFEEIRTKLLHEWGLENYVQLPSVHETVYNFIKKF
jgi:hypothetical protein